MKASEVIRKAGLHPSIYQHWRNFDRLVEDGILPIEGDDPHCGSGNHREYLPSAVPALAAWVSVMEVVRGKGSSAPYSIIRDAFRLWHSKSNPAGRDIVGSRDGIPYLWWTWEEVASDVADGHAIIAVQIGDTMPVPRDKDVKSVLLPCICGENVRVELPEPGAASATTCGACGRTTQVGRFPDDIRQPTPQHDASDTPAVQKDTRTF